MNFTQFLLMAAPTTPATGDGASTGGGLTSMLLTALPLVAMVVAMYFLIIRPQKKKEKDSKDSSTCVSDVNTKNVFRPAAFMISTAKRGY